MFRIIHATRRDFTQASHDLAVFGKLVLVCAQEVNPSEPPSLCGEYRRLLSNSLDLNKVKGQGFGLVRSFSTTRQKVQVL